jgi:hypothetical protein
VPNLLNDTGDKVNQYLEKLVKNSGGTITYTRLDRGCFTVNKGSTLVHVLVKEWKEESPLVECISYVVRGAIISEELAIKLLLMNWEMPFGSFSIDPEDNCIVLSLCLIGSTIDQEELTVAIENIAEVADEVDDLIIETYGGITALQDLIKKRHIPNK